MSCFGLGLTFRSWGMQYDATIYHVILREAGLLVKTSYYTTLKTMALFQKTPAASELFSGFLGFAWGSLAEKRNGGMRQKVVL